MAQADLLTFKLGAIAAVAIALTACGGGSDDNSGAAMMAMLAAQQQAAPAPTPADPAPADPAPAEPAPEPEESTPAEEEAFFDPYYTVCRGTSPKCYNDWGAFSEDAKKKVLVYSRTGGPRHANLGPAMTAGGLNPSDYDPTRHLMQAGLKRILEAEGFSVDITEDVATLASRINGYGTVIFASSNRDTLWNAAVPTSNDAARTALRNYMRRGGGFVGLHNAFGTEYNWPYYEGLLGNANFYNHGPNRPGQVELLGEDPSLEGLPRTFAFRDEWYNLEPFPTNVKFLMKANVAVGGAPHPGHPDFHPVTWCQYYDGGRAWLSTLGHYASHFSETGEGTADSEVNGLLFQKAVVQAVKSTSGLTPFCTTPTAENAPPAAAPAAPAS